MIIASLIGLSLAAFLIYRIRNSQQLEAPTPAADSLVRIDNFDLFYQDSGKGLPILFLHGIGASSFCWRYQLEDLANSYRVIALDLPGFGRSSKHTDAEYTLESQTNRIIQFIEKLQLKDFVIVGSSMGGLLGLSLAQHFNTRIKSLILLAPAVEPKIVPAGLSRIGWTSSFLMPIMTRGLIERIMRRVNANKDNLSSDVVTRYYEPYTQKEALVTFIKSIKTLRNRNIKRLIQQNQVPTLTLYGAKDNMVPLWVMQSLDKKLKDNTLRVNSEAGHHLQEDDHQWTNQQIREFLTSKLN